jgi:hypothetical protein
MGHSGSPGEREQDLPPQPPQPVQFSRPIDPTNITTANSNHVVTPSLARPPALSSTPPAVQSAPRVGAVVRSWSTARGTGAAQTVWNEATSPSPMDQDPPAMLGKRTTQALVAQGIEHRFPKVLCRTVRSVPWDPSLFPSHSRSFVGVRQLSRGYSGAGHGQCRPEMDTTPES